MSFKPGLFLACLALFGFSASALAYPVTVKSCNRDVTFDAAPSRAISHDVNLTEMMLALKLQDRMVGYTGISVSRTMDAEIRSGLKGLPELSPKDPTREVLLGADADFYFAGWNYGMEVGGDVTPETLAPFGVKVYELSESCIHVMKRQKPTMDDMFIDLANLGIIFGVPERAQALIDGYRGELAAMSAKLDKARPPIAVFVYDSGEDQPFTAGRFAIPTALIEAAGGRNIMDDVATSWTKVSWEPVVERKPEVVVIVNYGDVTAQQKIAFMKGNPAFASIPAVRDNRFVVLDYVEATPGPRNIRAIARLAKAFE